MQLVTGTLLCSCSGVVTFPVVSAVYEQGAAHLYVPDVPRPVLTGHELLLELWNAVLLLLGASGGRLLKND